MRRAIVSNANKPKRASKFARKTTAVRGTLNPIQDPYQSLIAIYLLRLALGMRDSNDISALEDMFMGGYLVITGLNADLASYPDDMDLEEYENNFRRSRPHKNQLCRVIRNRIKVLLAQEALNEAPLYSNLEQLAAGLGLSECDQEVLLLSLLLSDESNAIHHFISMYTRSNEAKDIPDFLHIMTTRSKDEIAKSLSPSSPLCHAGWLDPVNAPNVCSLVATPSLAGILFKKLDPENGLEQLFLNPLKPSRLKTCDYPRQQIDLEILIPTLRESIAKQKPGINVLIYGPSTISKRELARLLAKSIGSPLYEVPEKWLDQPFLTQEDRFIACKTIQQWLVQQQQPALMLIDEAEEVLPQRRQTTLFDDEDSYQGINLGRIQHQLANNPLPIIWIIDKPRKLDSVCLRQFTYSLEIESMPDALRGRYIARITRGLTISTRWRQQLIHRQDLSLKQIEKAADIARLNANTADFNAEAIMERVINSHTRLFKRPMVSDTSAYATGYDLRFTNTSTSLPNLLSGLRRQPQANLCFYGAPGTGKTAFANYLANQLGLPILIKRASDLLDKYIGESEKNIAAMFAEAKRKRAILLLDEADSLLSDRRDTSHNWEISKVNEMLTHMEGYEGIFIATTNLMERMDTASLRRFDFKVKFDYLNGEQRWELFLQEAQRLGLELPDYPEDQQALKQQIQRLTQLTPGDFAVINRQMRFNPEPLSCTEIIERLQEECAAKGESFSRMGFVY